MKGLVGIALPGYGMEQDAAPPEILQLWHVGDGGGEGDGKVAGHGAAVVEGGGRKVPGVGGKEGVDQGDQGQREEAQVNGQQKQVGGCSASHALIDD